MRFLKIASNENPDTDFIDLNDLNGFFCTSFQMQGLSRNVNYLQVQNRNFDVSNKPSFASYILTIEILTEYALYERKYNDLLSFIDRNKKNGLRLIYAPYDDFSQKYCVCTPERLEKIEKRLPVSLILTQNSLWFSDPAPVKISQTEAEGNMFTFADDGTGYHAAAFLLDESVNEYCVQFFNGTVVIASFENACYNSVPLNVKIYGESVNPVIALYRSMDENPFRQTQVFVTIPQGWYLEINSDIENNGVWLVNIATGEKTDCVELVNNEMGSPYLYVDHGKYYARVIDVAENVCETEITYREEYSGV